MQSDGMTSPTKMSANRRESPQLHGQSHEQSGISLRDWPPIYVLATHLNDETIEDIEDRLTSAGANLTYDITEARLVLGKVASKRRAEFELRCRKLVTEEGKDVSKRKIDDKVAPSRPAKRTRTRRSSIDSITADEDEGQQTLDTDTNERTQQSSRIVSPSGTAHGLLSSGSRRHPLEANQVKVVTLEWFDASSRVGHLLPLTEYEVYTGALVSGRVNSNSINISAISQTSARDQAKSEGYVPVRSLANTHTILERAKEDAPSSQTESKLGHGARRFGATQEHKTQSDYHHTSSLLQQTTTEYEGDESEIPKMPDWMDVKYACQRPTLPDPPNQAFVERLKRVRLARTLTLDEIGVRAYSTIIAAIAAYPYVLTTPRELVGLPGCDHKVANIWIEWKNTGDIAEAKKMEEDEMLKILETFWNIWGVGAKQARDFYLHHGWRDLDDVIEFGWDTLNRMQQIGLKFYDEFQQGIPRSEVEQIASVIRTHAIKIRDHGIEVVIVGGHRRGKSNSNDVDVIISHRSLEFTAHLATDLVLSLEKENWITHTLIHSENNTERGQATLPYRAPGVGGGHGFDSLDKALVVWQDPHWPTRTEDLAANPKAKNPNVHRRVDIIISPWRTVGCAVMGWSGGTTFQRDVRRFAKNVKGWKFDSSGIRNRATGQLVALEGPDGVSGSWQDAERRVFDGLGLEYREPWERCTN